jgi:hypothetical protein
VSRDRLDNILFAIVIGTMLGITAWQVWSRELPAPRSIEPGPTTNQVMRVSTGNKETATDTMIDKKELSDHEAKYYRKVEQ